MKTSTAIILDTRRSKKDGTYPVKLRVTNDRKFKYYGTEYSLSEEDFEKVKGKSPRGDFKDISFELQDAEKKAANIIASLPLFKWEAFEKQYLNTRPVKNLLSDAFADREAFYESEGREGSASNCNCAKKSFLKFMPNARLSDVTPEFLKRYEAWMKSEKKGITTIAIYLRTLRVVINKAMEDSLFPAAFHPFGRGKYEIPIANNKKKALTTDDISAIYYYNAPKPSIEKAKDYWLFIYFCNGINVKDLCLLRYENIKGEMIEFTRAKTERTKRKIESINVVLNDDMREIIRKWGNAKDSDKTFIFPHLWDGITPKDQRRIIQQLTHVINDNMKHVKEALKIDLSCTTYAARHSFATTLLREGVNPIIIGGMMGHSDIKTTQNYFAGFENDTIKEAAQGLTAFKVKKLKEAV